MDGGHMDSMMIFGPEHFTLHPDAPEVFGWLGCGEASPCYTVFREAWPRAVELLGEAMHPMAAWTEHGDLLTVFLTLGDGPEKQVHSLFERQQYVLASLVNTLCDEMLFQMNRQFSLLLQTQFNAEHRYLADRLEPGIDFCSEIQRQRFAPLQSAFPHVKISASGILTPAKSMMYCVILTRHACDQTKLHDCSTCSQKDCIYRKA